MQEECNLTRFKLYSIAHMKRVKLSISLASGPPRYVVNASSYRKRATGCYYVAIMEDQMDNQMNNHMETEDIWGVEDVGIYGP